jgi:hypothetical protein
MSITCPQCGENFAFPENLKYHVEKQHPPNPVPLPYNHERVHHPPKYNYGKIEVIDFINDQNLGFETGNVIKYVCRTECAHQSNQFLSHAAVPMPDVIAQLETDIEDLRKAAWYLDRYIDIMERKRKGLMPKVNTVDTVVGGKF